VTEVDGAKAKAAGDAASFAEAHKRLLADSSIQFDLAPLEIKPPPGWLIALQKFFEAIFPLLEILFWGLLIAAGLFVAYLVYLRTQGRVFSWRRKRDLEEVAEDWQPAEAPARALLREADALAAEGRYTEAAHLLLHRSIEDIDRRRPHLVRPALTSRDIASSPHIPSKPKSAFAAIVMMVERSLFGGRALGEQDWGECREAYREFALAGAWRE
jgi:hypothetical protein